MFEVDLQRQLSYSAVKRSAKVSLPKIKAATFIPIGKDEHLFAFVETRPLRVKILQSAISFKASLRIILSDMGFT
jgi:hypothetical protein